MFTEKSLLKLMLYCGWTLKLNEAVYRNFRGYKKDIGR